MGKGHGHGSDAPSEKRQVAGFDFLLPFLVVGTWVAFVIFGLAQEGVTRTKFGEGDAAEQFKFTTFLVLLQSIGNAVVAAVILLFTKGTKTSLSAGVPLSEWLIVALGYAGAHKFGLWSLLYIPFPLQVLLKSCKTIPVMIGGPPPPPRALAPPAASCALEGAAGRSTALRPPTFRRAAPRQEQGGQAQGDRRGDRRPHACPHALPRLAAPWHDLCFSVGGLPRRFRRRADRGWRVACSRCWC